MDSRHQAASLLLQQAWLGADLDIEGRRSVEFDVQLGELLHVAYEQQPRSDPEKQDNIL